MKICLVTAFPPSQQGLNEYAFHIARELRQTPGLSLTVLADDLPPNRAELDGFSVVRCWSFNKLSNPWRLLKQIHRLKPDVVWFNLGFASFGDRALPAFLGIILPALTRAAGYDTHVTLHQLMETVDLKDAGVRSPLAYKVGGFLATQIVLSANSVAVMLPAYRNILRDKYRRGTIFVRHHGSLFGRPEYPDFSRRANPDHRILAFGKWGTYKRLELLLASFESVSGRFPRAQLVIGGTDHPKAPGYLQSVERAHRDHPRIKFLGYVAEDEIPALLQSTSIMVMPYSSSAGSSGIAHLAGAYGLPIVASDIPDCRQLVDEEGLAIEFYQPGNAASLADTLVDLLEKPDRQVEMALQNVSAALRTSMPEIVRQYVRTFDRQHELGMLKSLARIRNLPRWLPLRSWYAQRATRRLRRISWETQLLNSDYELTAVELQAQTALRSIAADNPGSPQ